MPSHVKKLAPYPPGRKPRKQGPNLSLPERQAAFELFMQRKLGIEGIARQLKISHNGLTTISRTEDWFKKREEIELAVQQAYERELAVRLAKDRFKVVDRHLSITENIDRHLYLHVKGKRKLPVSRLESVAKSLVASAQVAARAIGMDDATQQAQQLIQSGLRPVPRIKNAEEGRTSPALPADLPTADERPAASPSSG